MEKIQKTDRRTRYTCQTIKDILLEELKTKPYSNVIILPFHSCKKKRAPFTALFHIDFLIHLSYSTVLQPMSLNFFPKMGQSLVLHQMPSQLLSFDHILLQIPMQIHNSKHLSE